MFTLRKDPDIASESFLAKLYSLYITRKTIATIFLPKFLPFLLSFIGMFFHWYILDNRQGFPYHALSATKEVSAPAGLPPRRN